MGEFLAFVINKECIKNVHKLISNVVLSFKGDAEKFYPAFYKCISDVENPFGGSSNNFNGTLCFTNCNSLPAFQWEYLTGCGISSCKISQTKFERVDYTV